MKKENSFTYRYEGTQAYPNASAGEILAYLETGTFGFIRISNQTTDKEDGTISFTIPPCILSNETNIHIHISCDEYDTTKVTVVAESSFKGKLFGYTKSCIETVFSTIDKKFTPESRCYITIKEAEQRIKNVGKIVWSAIILLAIVIGCVFIVKSCIDDSKNGDEEWEICHKCDGDGKVTNELGFETKCTRCNGVGYIP